MTLLVKKPISVLDKAVTVSWRDAFRALGKAIPHFAAGKTAEFTTDLGDLALAIGVAVDQGDVAWLLIRRALNRALMDLVRDHRDLFCVDPPEGHEAIETEVGLDIDAEVLELDERFFRDPGSLDLLDRIQPPLTEWLKVYGVPSTPARAVAERLRPYFVLGLHDEWARSPSDYVKLREAIDTPFTRAQDLERAWLRYQAYLWRVVNEPMFAEAFGLKTIYVPLRGYWERSTKSSKSVADVSCAPEPAGAEKNIERVVVELTDALDSWLAANKKGDSLRVLSGGPGSGKSSFTRMYAAVTMTKGVVRVLYVPLHLFDPKGDLVASVGDYVRTSRALPSNPLEVASGDQPRRLLIIFDGLDELAMQGKLAAETARDFVREIERTIDKQNQMSPWLSVLISGRELVVQANATEFRRPGQILHLLPYAGETALGDEMEHLPSPRPLGDIAEVTWHDPSKLLAHDQRADWWRKYREATGIEPEIIPEAFRRGELGDVTRQPLLLYLVALSFARKKLTLDAGTNMNAVYADLVEAVWERGWERRAFRGIQELSKADFIRVLEEIGLAAWHEERRTTTVKAIREHFETASLTKILDAFQQGAESGVTRLLAAFYFRQHGESDGEKTFEFTHKSFGEYLTARRVVRTLDILDRAIKAHEDDPDSGKDTIDALAKWAEICGPAPLDNYYVRFLNREIAGRDRADVARWQSRLAAMLSTVARRGMPMERTKPRPAFHEEFRRARNAEEALFACAAACGDVTGNTTDVAWPSPTSAGDWIRRLQGQRHGPPNRVVLRSLRHLNLTKAILHMLDLYGAQLDGALLEGAQMDFACLERASLCRANLRGANVSRANLRWADLREADLRGTTFQESGHSAANLERAETAGAKFDPGFSLEEFVKTLKDSGDITRTRKGKR